MKRILIITGSAPCVTDDLAVLIRDVLIPADVDADYMAIGLDAVDKHKSRIEYVATFHPVDIPGIHERRRASGGNEDFQIISHWRTPGVDILVPDFWKPTGSSSLLGVQAALTIMDYQRVILCGCPLDGKNADGSSYATFREGWKKRGKEVKGRVKSMSGWTLEFLGAATIEWIGEDR